MSATARDQDKLGQGISRMEFYHEDTLIGTDFAAPFSATWSDGSAGDHLL